MNSLRRVSSHRTICRRASLYPSAKLATASSTTWSTAAAATRTASLSRDRMTMGSCCHRRRAADR